MSGEGRLFAWLAHHPSEAEALHDVAPGVVGLLWTDAWRAGAWDAVKQNATLGLNLSQIIERLEELHALYADVDIERQAERELEASSRYWKSEP
jgi:hypothetical protein